MNDTILRFLDTEGLIKIWPSKQILKLDILNYLSGKFEYGRFYTEPEVNQVINEWHTFNDYFLLRRGLIDAGFLARTRDGARYWREDVKS